MDHAQVIWRQYLAEARLRATDTGVPHLIVSPYDREGNVIDDAYVVVPEHYLLDAELFHRVAEVAPDGSAHVHTDGGVESIGPEEEA